MVAKVFSPVSAAVSDFDADEGRESACFPLISSLSAALVSEFSRQRRAAAT